MISFIIIGRNEGWKITKCIQSVFDSIKSNALLSSEVLYIDSKSSDDSLERAKKFNDIKIYQLTDKFNAAIARNLGVEKSTGDILFFIDGDMEIYPQFLSLVYNKEKKLLHPFISGQLKNFNYDEKGGFLNNTWQYKGILNGDKFFSTTGGIFLIDRKLWVEVGGMDNRFKRGQDLDIALSLSGKGIKLLRKKEIIANHYTIAHTHYSRMWQVIISGDIAYPNSFLLRKHFFNPNIYPHFIKSYYSLGSLFLLILLAILLGKYFIITAYLIIVMLKTYKAKAKSITRNFELFAYFLSRDLCFIYFLFIPLRKISKSDINYMKIK